MIWIFCLIPFVFARDLETEHLARLRAAKSIQEVQLVRDSYDQLVSEHRICRIQMKQKLIPSACYKTLRLERQWRLIPRETSDRIRKLLDERCKTAAVPALQTQSSEIHDAADVDISPFCRSVLRKVHEIKRYRALDSSHLEDGWPDF